MLELLWKLGASKTFIRSQDVLLLRRLELLFQTGTRGHCTLKSQLILVKFYFSLLNFRLRELVLPWYFLHTFYFVHKQQCFIFRDFSEDNLFSSPRKLAHMLISILSKVLQVNNKRSKSTINENFNLCRKKCLFLNYHRKIELLFYQSMY